MKIPHAVVWLDHHEARVCFLHEEDAKFDEQHIRAHEHHGHPHRDGHRHDDHQKQFFDAIIHALEPVAEILLVGPSRAKNDLHDFVAAKKPDLHKRILGVENADHPSDGQLAANARAFFKKADAMLGTSRLIAPGR